MVTKRVHGGFWDFGYIHQSEIMSCIASDGQDGRTGIERITEETPDISKWLDFDIYDLLVYICDKSRMLKRMCDWLDDLASPTTLVATSATGS